MNRLLITLLLLTNISCPTLLVAETATEADLPNVLIIGDSISMAFTPYVVQQLDGKAVVKHHKGNAQHTGTGLAKLDQWIGNTQWDVIHFNWGLWDLCYRHPESKVQGRRDKVNGTVTTSLEQYETNLDELVSRLKRTDAKLIWANTTVVPKEEAGRIVGDDVKYNEVAAKIMKKNGILINDLHSLTKQFSADDFASPGNVHYTQDGYRKIGQQVTDHILKALKDKQSNPGEKP
ncbi:SGNH/GDSL hydrolase family protein [Stieleria sp. TO1_6]|uniref:SGNH/GDSL hydrolase family protein n=1 Tax=Stieleria tagensis TaxID=2956795 RepID=UPI00209BB53B|nr:SGNH/GDSL hydrolase family protein [Stieleria tagensis]MCO8121247.1 SGNH/GDSL hydrolase family protein [Stieleria tagensis]